MQILPFAVLLGGILCFWRLTRSSELIVARAAGVSAWEFLAAPTFCALLFGAAAVMVGSPLSSVMFARAERLENTYLNVGGGPLAMDSGQLWLRQSDRALTPQGVAIIHARDVQLHGKQLTADHVSVFRLDAEDRLLTRIEASRALLDRGHWELVDARTLRPDEALGPVQKIALPTDLTVRRVRKASPRLTHCRYGLCRASSNCCASQAFPASATACIFNRCWHCRCCARRWHWSPPASPCVRRGEAAWRA